MADPSWTPGMFVWRELMTDDVERARRFYGELFGWTWKGAQTGGGRTYWLASAGDRQIAGMTAKPPGPPMPTAWSSYALVLDVDATARRATGAGGRVLKEATDIPDVGRFAVLADPWGAVFFPFRPTSDESTPPPMPPPAGTFCWETLVTPDPKGAIAFYGQVLGLGTGRTPSGEGTVFTAGELMVADVQPARPPGAPAYWATYVAVEGAETARDLAVRLGGRVLAPRIDVPKVGTVSVVADPSGAALGLFQPERR